MRLNDSFATTEIPAELLERAQARSDEPPADVVFEGGYLLSACCRAVPFWNASNVLEVLVGSGFADTPVGDLLDERGRFTGDATGMRFAGICATCARPILMVVSEGQVISHD